ncbi:MAG TPA: hypothetical protein VFF98_01625 [Novosphingobium sp.]|nr:hypothetical protein [Novosphingobium sp.]
MIHPHDLPQPSARRLRPVPRAQVKAVSLEAQALPAFWRALPLAILLSCGMWAAIILAAMLVLHR